MTDAKAEPLSILLVEDNPADVRMAREALDGCEVDYEMRVAGNADEALARLRRKGAHAAAPRPDLVLLDLMLPGESGFVVLEEIRRDALLRHIPVVVLTGSQLEQDLQQSFGLHADAHIRKPLGLGAYIREMKFALALARNPSGDGETAPGPGWPSAGGAPTQGHGETTTDM